VWDKYDRVVAEARERGLRPLAIVGYPPSWAAPDENASAVDPDRYAAYAAEAARHFAPLGLEHFELWNEPNLSSFWKPQPDPKAYAALVRAAYPAIKAAAPGATVLAGSMAPAGGREPPDCGTRPSWIAPIPFLEELYALGVGGSFDALSFHPYTFPRDPGEELPCSGWHQMDGTEPSLRSVMEANGDGDKQIWATEYGARVDEVGEERQAELVAAAARLWPDEPWAGPLFVYSLRDRQNEPWNLVREDWSRRPAWDAFREVVAEGGDR